MKKTLVALAAIAATASFAQSSVVLSGNFDFAAVSKSGTVVGANGSTITTTDNGASSTSTIKITATEDLGGGLKITGLYEIDPRGWAEDATATTNVNNGGGTAVGTTSSVTSKVTGLSRGEAYIQIGGGFGTVALGAPNSFGLGTAGTASPLGTGIGSGYTFQGATNSMMTNVVNTRYGRAAKYTSPSMNGFSVGALYAPGNDQAVGSGTANTTTGSLAIPNARQYTELNLAYSKGPLNLSYTNIASGAQTNATGWFRSGTGAGAAAISTNIFAANYNVGALTVYGGMWNGNAQSPAAANTNPSTVGGWRGGAKFSMGKVDLIGQYTEVRTTAASSETKAATTGLRIDYNLSKTAAAYVGIEKHDTGAATGNQMDMVGLGLRKAF